MKAGLFIYNFLILVIGVLTSIIYPIILLVRFQKKPFFLRDRFFPRLKYLKESFGQSSVIWFHAASVGEINIACRLITKIRKQYPEYKILLTTNTSSGFKHSEEQGLVTHHLPLDFACILKKFTGNLNLKALIIIETELWPNLILQAAKSKCRIYQYNAKISESSFPWYSRLNRLTGGYVKNIDFLFCQNSRIAEKFKKLGLDKSKITLFPSSKFYVETNLKNTDWIGKAFNKKQPSSLFVWGSVDREEVPILLAAAKKIKKEFRKTQFVLVPRHLELIKDLETFPDFSDFKSITWQAEDTADLSDFDLIVVDAIGYLKHWYSLANIVFVGGSMGQRNGQNMIEPLFYAKPVLIGTELANFKDEVKHLDQLDALNYVCNSDEIFAVYKTLTEDSKKTGEKYESIKLKLQEYSNEINQVVDSFIALLK